MTTLITGGAGLIGSDVAVQLADRGEDVVVYDLDPSAASSAATAAIEGDIANRSELAAAIDDYDVDRVLHLAAMIGSTTNEHPTKATEANVGGVDHVFSVAMEADLDRVAWASTHSIYGSWDNYEKDEPVSEDARPPAAFTAHPDQSYYAAMKQLNEYQARMYADHGLDTYGVRPTFVFGPKRDRGWKGTMIDDALDGEAHIPHPPDALINFVYVADVADLFVRLLLDEPSHRVYNTGGHTLSMREIADVLEAETGGTVTVDQDGDYLTQPARYDHGRATDDLGYELTSFSECVRDYIDRVQ
jgi:nucleoside-diphosphate-sugar epimerase